MAILVVDIFVAFLVLVVVIYKVRTYTLVRSRAFYIIAAATVYMFIIHTIAAVLHDGRGFWIELSLPFWVLMAIASVVLYRDLDKFLRKRK